MQLPWERAKGGALLLLLCLRPLAPCSTDTPRKICRCFV